MFKLGAVEHIVDWCIALTERETFEGGFTIYAETGRDFFQPGYLVGGIMPSLVLSPSLRLSEVYTEVAEWYRGAYRISTPVPIVGGWVKDGFLFIDLITVCYDRETALNLGSCWDQFSVGHFDSTGTFKELEIVK
jgi:hypothetical protein